MKNTIFSIIVLSGLFLISSQAVAQNNTTKIDFKIKNFGMYVKGSFSEATVVSSFDENNLASSFIKASVAINSLSTNNEKRDKHLLEQEYFDEPAYKQLKLVSTKIEKTTSNNYEITAKLTIKETTKTIVIPVKISQTENELVMNANFELNRKDYGVGGSSWVLSNTVKIEVKHTIKSK